MSEGQRALSGPQSFWRRWVRLAWYRLRGLHFAAAAEAQDLMNLESRVGVGVVASTYCTSEDFLDSLEDD